MSKKRRISFKVIILSILILIAGTLLLGNVLLLDLKGKTFFSDIDFNEEVGFSMVDEVVYPQRGRILDSDGNVLATDAITYKIYCILNKEHEGYKIDENGNLTKVADYVDDAEYTAYKLAPILGCSKSYLYDLLSNEDLWQVELGDYGDNLSYAVKEEIEALDLPGIHFISSTSRYYPNNEYASHLLGFIEKAVDDGVKHNVGAAGVEALLEEELAGKTGHSVYYADVNGNIVTGGEVEQEEEKNGYDVRLTLNSMIQQALDDCLEKTMNMSNDVEKAWGIVMNAKTGAILGYDSYPSYNPNIRNIEDYNDYVSAYVYEPGSVMKTFTYATLIEETGIDLNTKVNCDAFYVAYGAGGNKVVRTTADKSDMSINNAGQYEYGNVSLKYAYVMSLNTGIANILEKYVAPDTLKEYYLKYGFTEFVDTMGISEGWDSGAINFSDPYSAITNGYGAGMNVTALQLIQAYSTFTNKGVMIKPYIIDAIIDPQTNDAIYTGGRTEVKKIVSEQTASTVLSLMDSMINTDGIGSNQYRLANIRVGGKTGTQSVWDEEEGYGETTIHSIVLAFPIEDPEVLIYVAYQDEKTGVNTNRTYVNELERVTAATLNMYDNNSTDAVIKKNSITLSNYVNHPVEPVNLTFSSLGIDLVIIGDGDTVIKQYPEEGKVVMAGGRAMLLTSNNNILMPDMTGWSRSDVAAYWDLTGIKITIDGYGYVCQQNIEPGQPINKVSEIIVKLN